MQLYPAMPAGEPMAVQMHCRPLRVSMTSTLRPAPPHGGGGRGGGGVGEGTSASEFFRTWSALPARTEMAGR